MHVSQNKEEMPTMKFTVNVCKTPGEGGGGVSPYKSDVGACRKISKTPLKGTRMGVSQIYFHLWPKRYINGSANFNSKKDNFRTIPSQGLFESIVIHL